MEDHAEDLAGYEMSKGTIRFPVDEPLPTKLVKQMVKERGRGERGTAHPLSVWSSAWAR